MNKSSLTELFDIKDQQEIEKEQNKILLFDAHNLAFRTLFSAIYANPTDNEKFFFWRHLFMNSFFNTIVKFNPIKVILAFDTKASWRYRVYSEYKSNRKDAREKTAVDFEKFFSVLEEFKKDIKETFTTIYVIEYSGAEADDIIAVLCRNLFKKNSKIIVSTDKDLHQLLTEENNQQFDPIKEKMVTCINPKKELDIKIITGDRSDSIPPIKPRIGIATAEHILRQGLDKFLNQEDNKQYKNNYVRNSILIDFNFIPEDIKNGIINTFCTYQIKEIEGSKIVNFFTKNRLIKMMEEWQNFGPMIKSLK